MFLKIKKRIEKELRAYLNDLDRLYKLRQISPVILDHVKEFALRKGKRVRPGLFVIGYLGFAKKISPGLYRSAVSLELLHDFMLVHDDIIDKSATRRGKPSMHAKLQKYLSKYPKPKFNGQDLAIVIGDIMYAFSLHSFLSIKENPAHKEAALKKLMEAAFYTGSGEFIELLLGLKTLEETKRSDIDKIYDYKTATYTFAAPLSIGATLAGAPKLEVDKLFQFGISLGRAFQIKDDIIGLFGDESEIGKPNLTDIREAKRTILIWYAFNHGSSKDKSRIKTIFSKKNVRKSDLLEMQKIVTHTRALDYGKSEIQKCLARALKLMRQSRMKPSYKTSLEKFSTDLLKIK